jgi:hypothetical protein
MTTIFILLAIGLICGAQEREASAGARQFHRERAKLDKTAKKLFGKSWDDCNYDESEQVLAVRP